MIDQPFNIKDIIGLLADVMTLFGVSGFFAWSFVRKSIESRSIADAGITIFALSVKAFLSLIFLLLLFVPAFFSHLFMILLISGHYGGEDGLWNAQKPLAYALSYLVTALWVIPVAILSVSAIFTWSLDPFHRFVRAFKGAKSG